MVKDKQKEKEQLVEELMDSYEDRHDENGWNHNDGSNRDAIGFSHFH